jgi:hypothetical protein
MPHRLDDGISAGIDYGNIKTARERLLIAAVPPKKNLTVAEEYYSSQLRRIFFSN